MYTKQLQDRCVTQDKIKSKLELISVKKTKEQLEFIEKDRQFLTKQFETVSKILHDRGGGERHKERVFEIHRYYEDSWKRNDRLNMLSIPRTYQLSSKYLRPALSSNSSKII
jgi:hypothetical protein